MTVGNFTELYGIGFDFGVTGFDSISGSDSQIVYGLNGDDVLNSTTTFSGDNLSDGRATIILVGGTGRNSYQVRNSSTAIVIEIETFDLTEGNVSYEDFVSRYRDSNNYQGNLSWNELAAKEIDLDRLGLSPDTIEKDLATIARRSTELTVTR